MLLMTNLTICLGVSVYSWELLLGAAEASVRNTGVDWIVCSCFTRDGVHDHLSVGSDHVLQGDSHTQWSQVWETIGESFHWIALNQSWTCLLTLINQSYTLTCLPSTATRGLSLNLRAPGLFCFCFATLGLWLLGLRWISWMILRLVLGVVRVSGAALRKLVPDSPTSRLSTSGLDFNFSGIFNCLSGVG